MTTDAVTLPTADVVHYHTGLVSYSYNLQPEIDFHVVAGGSHLEQGNDYLRSAQQELGGVLAFNDEQPFVRGHAHLKQSEFLAGLDHYWCLVFDLEMFAFRARLLDDLLNRLRCFDWHSLTPSSPGGG